MPLNTSIKISAIIITKNEAACIERCLMSLLWVDEIIIVDGASTDETLNIIQYIQATQFKNIHVYTHANWQGFGQQKNIALQYASYNWVLSIDADEVISAELAHEIRIKLNQKHISNPIDEDNNAHNYMYQIHRLNYFLGKAIQYSGWQQDKVVRLFHKDYAQFSNDKVHESVQPKNNNAHKKDVLNALFCFQAKIHHYSYTSFSQVLQKIDQYSTLGASQLHLQNKYQHIGIFKPIKHGLGAFIKSYIIKKGFLDGFCGFNIALMNGLSSYYKYIKLRYILAHI
jgi:glycosyltransferase involved in cell wall biosynthesis